MALAIDKSFTEFRVTMSSWILCLLKISSVHTEEIVADPKKISIMKRYRETTRDMAREEINSIHVANVSR